MALLGFLSGLPRAYYPVAADAPDRPPPRNVCKWLVPVVLLRQHLTFRGRTRAPNWHPATFTGKDAVTAKSYSKSVLRVAADVVVTRPEGDGAGPTLSHQRRWIIKIMQCVETLPVGVGVWGLLCKIVFPPWGWPAITWPRVRRLPF